MFSDEYLLSSERNKRLLDGRELWGLRGSKLPQHWYSIHLRPFSRYIVVVPTWAWCLLAVDRCSAGGVSARASISRTLFLYPARMTNLRAVAECWRGRDWSTHRIFNTRVPFQIGAPATPDSPHSALCGMYYWYDYYCGRKGRSLGQYGARHSFCTRECDGAPLRLSGGAHRQSVTGTDAADWSLSGLWALTIWKGGRVSYRKFQKLLWKLLFGNADRVQLR